MKLLKFEADWCGPCKMMQPILEQIAQERPDVEIESIDVERQPERAREYHVRALPTLVLLDAAGDIVTTHTGSASLAQVLLMLEKGRKQ